MGMFDYVKCERPLPDGWDLTNDYVGLQTKCFGCEMTTILIRADGRLMIEDIEYEATPDDELPYPDIPIIGCIRPKSRKWRDLNFHGVFYFGGLEVIGYQEPDGRGYRAPIYRNHDYAAKFTDGNLVSLTVDGPHDATEQPDCPSKREDPKGRSEPQHTGESSE